MGDKVDVIKNLLKAELSQSSEAIKTASKEGNQLDYYYQAGKKDLCRDLLQLTEEEASNE